MSPEESACVGMSTRAVVWPVKSEARCRVFTIATLNQVLDGGGAVAGRYALIRDAKHAN